MNASGFVLLTALLSAPKVAPSSEPGRILEKPGSCHAASESDLIRLDFDGASVHDLVREVSRVLCKNFVLEPHIADLLIFAVSSTETRVGDLCPKGQVHPLSAAGALVMTDYASSIARLEWILGQSTTRP